MTGHELYADGLRRLTPTEKCHLLAFCRSPAESPAGFRVFCHLWRPLRKSHGLPRNPAVVAAGILLPWNLPHVPGRTVPQAVAALRRKRFRDRRMRLAVEQRFLRLADCDMTGLRSGLGELAALLSASRIGVDWAMLVRDILQWGRPGRPVQEGWTDDFTQAAFPAPKD